MPENSYWPRLIRTFRGREGLSQAAVGDRLGVDQTTVSRWERGLDIPQQRMRRQLRDLMRVSLGSRQDRAIRMRVSHSMWPQTLLRRGAVFLEANRAALAETSLQVQDLRGRTLYGLFGPPTDAVTETWEQTGIFDGEIALAIAVNRLDTPSGKPIYIRTLDTPHFSTDADIWCACEVRQIDRAEYHRLRQEFAGSVLTIPFDECR